MKNIFITKILEIVLIWVCQRNDSTVGAETFEKRFNSNHHGSIVRNNKIMTDDSGKSLNCLKNFLKLYTSNVHHWIKICLDILWNTIVSYVIYYCIKVIENKTYDVFFKNVRYSLNFWQRRFGTEHRLYTELWF